ncbi:MAG: hypothetical protein JNM00_05135, partial [Flavobacteriales bacterium]|nr:hypothetical protein [Flavobacteriales bacterium]
LIRVVRCGELQPEVPNDNEEGKQKNRRAEVKFFCELMVPETFKPQFSEFVVKGDGAQQLALNDHGTVLHIPDGCFVDQYGNPVNGPVYLRYREYGNASEMAFSGIPMSWDKNGQTYCFNSAGMFELRGFSGDEALAVAPGKSMTVDFVPATENKEVDFFRLDEKDNQWKKQKEINQVVNGELKAEFFIGGAWIPADSAANLDPMINPWNMLKGNENLRDGNVMAGIEEKPAGRSATLLAEGADAGHTYPAIIKGLNVESFGVYNCDQIYMLNSPVAIDAGYVDENGNKIVGGSVLSVIDLNYNGAFSFAPGHFICSAKGNNALALFTSKGDLYLLEPEEFKKMAISKGGFYTFQMKNVTREITNTEQLAKRLDINLN